MLNIETIEKLAKIQGKNSVSLYLNTNRKRVSSLELKTKLKDMLKGIKLSEEDKYEIQDKTFDFFSRLSPNTKSVAIFASKSFWEAFVFPFEVDDFIEIDDFFNLEPLLLILRENKNIGVLMVDSERARFLSIFLGELKEHRHLEDQIVHRQAKGGWSKERFARHEEDIIRTHLKNSLDFLIKIYKIYQFDYLLLRIDPELKHEFMKLLPSELQKKLKGEIKADMRESAQKIIEKALKIEKKETILEERDLIRELSDLLSYESGRARAIAGLTPVLEALYDKKISVLFINEELYVSGMYCKYCGRISLVEDFCAYDQTPNQRRQDLASVIVDEAIKQNAEVEVFKGDRRLKDMGNIAAILKEH